MPYQRKSTALKIEELLIECQAEALKRGHKGYWEPTTQDLEWVCERLGHKPTRREWSDAGLPHVSGKHVKD